MEIVLQYFKDLSPEQIDQFRKLRGLYEEWNAKINVISRKDMEDFYIHHVLHSLGIARVKSFEPGDAVLDIGTGGGFPGIPLAILFPETHFHLVDSIGKKIKVVEEVAQALELQNVTAEHGRAEKVKGTYDFIVSRAVTQIPRFMPWTKGKIKSPRKNLQGLSNGILYLKGGDLSEEVSSLPFFRIFELQDYFKQDFFETKKVLYIPFKV
ncbi:MAG TPA: 16S rRNA (guanine(527)-N(7))-methyltransferase RsmG [Cryomorphaceae bacterium]|nr:16S rRNA (guanine(527)-N(7))-methyltransferase RsmG [Owenweeksia sp.]HBF21246.1 16S rRNA (guanine(527)-N(7))-methyltransferase RsmG [Cryomorphaceae bacterium]|tara:strand:+ start:1341 stop:1970 length:630 start_codon:yes stop_codon:yes gene_type:complete